MRGELKRRLRYLWTFELANAVALFPLFYYVLSLSFDLGWFSLLSLILVCAILAVGASYWFLKERELDGSELLAQPRTRRLYLAAKRLLGGALAVTVAVYLVLVFVLRSASRAELLAGGALLVLALLEYVNYYYVQLMYDNRADIQYLLRHRRLKPAVMVRDLDI